MSTEFQCPTESDLEPVVDHLLTLIDRDREQAVVFALTGDLGAGKTTLVQRLAARLGVTQRVTSPTFTVMSQYEIEHPIAERLIHIDAYRIESEAECGPLRLSDVFADPAVIVCVEWPERIASILPERTVTLQFQIEADELRTITISPSE